MKHSYTVGCHCKRCTRELERRTQQSGIDAAQNTSYRSGRRYVAMIDRRERRLVELNDLGYDDTSDWS